MKMSNLSPGLASLFVVFSCVLFGMVPWFAKSLIEAGLSPYAVAFFRYSLVAIVLFPFLNFQPHKRVATFWALAGGVAVGIGWIGYVRALEYVPVSTLGVLYMTYPIFTLLIAWIWFNRIPSWQAALAAVLVMMAAFLALSPEQMPEHVMQRVLWAFVAPLTFGFCIIVLTVKLNDLNIFERMSGNALGAMLGISPLLLPLDASALLPSSAEGWGLLLGIALLTALLPQITYGVAAPSLGPARAAVLGSVELITMLVIGWGAYDEAVEVGQVMAVSLIFFAMWMGARTDAPRERHGLKPKLTLYSP